MTKTTKELADEAVRIISTDRKNTYAPAERNFGAIAGVWSALLQKRYDGAPTLDAKDVAILFAGMKLVREMWKHSDDNIIDAIGYTLLAAEVQAGEDSTKSTAQPCSLNSGNYSVPCSRFASPICPFGLCATHCAGHDSE